MKGKTVGVIIGIAIMVAVMTVLIIVVGVKTSMPHMTPEQLVAHEGELNGGVRVDGFVVENSIKFDINQIKLSFAIRGLDPQVTVNVVANTLKPDSFEAGKGVIIEGIYDKAKNLIIASKLMTKCPSKYEEKLNIKQEVIMNGAQWFVRTLRERGVEYVFVLCGNGLNAFLDACLDFDMKVIDTRNEQGASYMADAWGRFTRRIGVVAVSSGPGHTNAVTGLTNAFWDGGPMLLVSGCSSQETRGMDNFQELDQVGMVAPVCKYASMVHHIETLENETNSALSAAVTGRPGPVHLTIPADVLSARIDETKLLRDKYPIAEVVQQLPGDADLVREAVELLASAKRPFIIIGSGTFYAQAGDALREFAQLTNIPIMSHIWDRACVDTVIPQYFGITNDVLNGAYPKISEADVILVLGARVDCRLGHGRPPVCSREVRWIRVDYEPSEINRTITPDIGIVGDTRSVLLQMTEEARRVGKWSNDEWLSEVRQSHAQLLSKWENLGRENVCPVPAIRICREIKKFLDRDVTFLLDGGNIGRWAHMMLFDRHPAHWFTCGASGVVGWGLPGAIAIKLAKPDKPVLLLSGDGSAGFTVTEIETALRFNTPYVAVVAHDGAWGIVTDGQKDGRRVASEFGTIRFDRVAEALGARGVFIENPDDLYPAIERGLNEDTVTFIHVPTQLAGISRWEKQFGKKG